MVRHIVMWNIKDGAEGMTKSEIMDKICSDLRALEGVVPVIKGLEVGRSFTSGDMHYDLALIVTLDKPDDLPAYSNHPAHLAVSKFVTKVRTARVTADFEI